MGTESNFWSLLDPESQDAVRVASRRKTYEPHDVVFHEADPSVDVFIIETGLMKISKLAVDGREIILELRRGGEIIGELAAIDGAPRSASGTCLEPTQVLILTAATFNELIDQNAAVAAAVLRTVTWRLREAADRQLEFGTSDALGRVCRRLVEIAEAAGADLTRPVEIGSPVSQHELAEWCGLSRDAVVRSLKSLRDLGWVETGRQRFVLHDPEAVIQRANVQL